MAEPVDDALLQRIRNRVTVESFDPKHRLSDADLTALIADACQAPSSFNLQHWRFVAVRDGEAKERLAAAAYGQRQVAEASATLIVLGDLRAIERLPEILERSVTAGAMPRERAEAWVGQAGQIYGDAGMARDEAIRSCSLASMAMMLAAEARGLGVGALVGFDADRVLREFEIPERYLPVMLLTVGRPLRRDETRKVRLNADEVLHLANGKSLPE